MYRELIYYENHVQIARVNAQNNEHKDNGNIESLFSELKVKIAKKEQGNHKWDWKEELRKAYRESFPYFPGRD